MNLCNFSLGAVEVISTCPDKHDLISEKELYGDTLETISVVYERLTWGEEESGVGETVTSGVVELTLSDHWVCGVVFEVSVDGDSDVLCEVVQQRQFRRFRVITIRVRKVK